MNREEDVRLHPGPPTTDSVEHSGAGRATNAGQASFRRGARACGGGIIACGALTRRRCAPARTAGSVRSYLRVTEAVLTTPPYWPWYSKLPLPVMERLSADT